MTAHPMPAAPEPDETSRALLVIAAMLDGDRALGLEAAAMVLGVPPRTFQKLASRPGFPKGAKMGKRITWRRRELLAWWDAERDRQNAA